MGAIGDWFNKLLGKGSASVSAGGAQPVAKTQLPIQKAPEGNVNGEEDSVKKDLNMFMTVVSKIKSTVGSKTQPVVSSAEKKTMGMVVGVGEKMNFGVVKVIIKIVLVIAFLGVILVVGATLFTNLKSKDQEVVEATPTPTSAPFGPQEVSVYADDAEILKLEEDVNVLEREFSGTNIKEVTLNAPNLDFEIKF